MQIFIKLPSGRTITISFDKDITIHEIKEMIQDREENNISNMEIIVNNEKLNNNILILSLVNHPRELESINFYLI